MAKAVHANEADGTPWSELTDKGRRVCLAQAGIWLSLMRAEGLTVFLLQERGDAS